jgi:steroid 5-alpha reductase family enzyme
MSCWFVVSVIIERNDTADIAWGFGFIVAAVTALIVNHNHSATAIIAIILVAIWGMRLGIHIGLRNLKKPEDQRYKIYRDTWGKWFYLRSYFQIFMLQGLLMFFVVFPVLVIENYATKNLSPLLIVGILIWVFGFIFESTGDKQLRQFLSNPTNKGKIMSSGLWKYTRHPNYFGEITQWWGIAIIALSRKHGWIGLLGPLTITFLILKVSGVPLLEKFYDNNPAYQEYKRRTSVIIPLPQKK